MGVIVVDNNAWLIQALFDNEIKTVIAYFSGSGDSGEITPITVVPVDDEIEIDEFTLEQIMLRNYLPANHDDVTEWGRRDFDARPMSLHELILWVCYDALARAHGGWEIDAGSFGQILINVPLGGRASDDVNALTIEYHESNDDSYNDYDEEEYNDE